MGNCSGTPIAELTTGKDGFTDIQTIENISVGTTSYKLYCKEYSAPEGYVASTLVYPLTFKYDSYKALKDKGDTSGELRTLYNFSYILPDSWINDLSFEQSSESGDMFHSSDKNLSFSIYNHRLDNIDTDIFDDNVYQAMHQTIDDFNNQRFGSYKCLLTHDTTFDGKPAFEKLIVSRLHTVYYVSYSALIYAGDDRFIKVYVDEYEKGSGNNV